MIVSATKVLELRAEYGLIHDLADRELNNPEGVGLEVRLDEAFRLVSDGFLGVETRDTPDIDPVGLEDGEDLVLEPGDYYLVETVETVEVPVEPVPVGGRKARLMPDVYPRSSLQRSGIFFKGTNTNPGYTGTLVFGLKNLSERTFRIERGARIAEVVFKQAVGKLDRGYEGQWQDGRVTTDGEETQI